MASKIKVDQIEGSTGTTVSLPSGQTLDLSSGSVTLPNTSVDLSTKVTGTLASGNLPTIPVSKGGTGLTSVGTANQVIAVNSGATALEFQTASSGKLKQFQAISDNTEYATNTGTTPTAVQGTSADITITPASTSSRILVCYNWGAIHTSDASSLGYGVIRYNVNGGAFGDVSPTGANNVAGGVKHHFKVTLEASTYMARPITYGFIHHPNTTNEVKYRPFFWTESSGGYTYINRSDRNSGNDASGVMFAYAIEIENN